jgi:hypothetical protein
VPQAIGQPFDRLVPAEAEVLGARAADRPATLPLAEFEQRTSAPVVDGDVLGMGMRSGERRGFVSRNAALEARPRLGCGDGGDRTAWLAIAGETMEAAYLSCLGWICCCCWTTGPDFLSVLVTIRQPQPDLRHMG